MTTPRPRTFSFSVDSKTLLLTIIALLQLLNSWFVYKTQQDVQTVHIATNSMKDALVKAARAVGNAEGRAELKQETIKQQE